MATALCASVVLPITWASAAQAAVVAAPAVATASAEAAASGHAVEVQDLTTSTTQVMAEPDGSFTLTSDREPVRMERDGEWIPIDTKLIQNADGSFSPQAADVELTFSGGGTGPALVLGDPRSDSSVSISWPGGLPVPVIADNVATYVDVLPGVDLVLTASGDSYSETLVVHNPEAAANPQLQQLRLTFTANKLNLTKTSDGGLAASNSSGQQVFAGATPVAWDSNYDPQFGAQPTATDPGGARTDQLALSMPNLNAGSSEATATAVLTTPSAALSGPDVQYPVFIDPLLSRVSSQHHLLVTSGPTSMHVYDSGADLKVGDCSGWAECNNIGVARSYFTFDISDLAGKYSWQVGTPTVFDATVKAYQIHNAAGCTAEPVSLYTTNAFNSSSVWPGPDYTSGVLATDSENYSNDCGTGNGGYDVFSSAAVAQAVTGAVGNASMAFGLKAPNENDPNQWKRFDTNPQLQVHFGYAPTSVTATLSGLVTCNGHAYSQDRYPTLTASAADNNSPHTSLWIRYWLTPAGSSTVLAQPSQDQLGAATSALDSQPSSSSGHWTSTYATANNTDYDFSVNIRTGVNTDTPTALWGSQQTIRFTSAWQPPTGPVSVQSAGYPTGSHWGLAADTPGSFALRDADPTAVGFTYHFDGGSGSEPVPTSCTTTQNGGARSGGTIMAVNGQARVIAPSNLSSGPHTLYVKPFNAGLVSTGGLEKAYTFLVSPAVNAASNLLQAEDTSRITYAGSAPSSNLLNLKRWTNEAGHLTTAGIDTVIPQGTTTLDGGLGMVLGDGTLAGTVPIYDCVNSSDRYTSLQTDCEGHTRVSAAPMAYIYASQPSGAGAPPTVALRRCFTASRERFDSVSTTCEGQTLDGVLGWVLQATDWPSSPRLDNLASGDGGRYIATNATGSTFTMKFTPPISANYALGAELITNQRNGALHFSLDDSEGNLAAQSLTQEGGTDPIDDSSAAPSERYVPFADPHYLQGRTSYTLTVTVAGPGTNGGGFGAAIDYLMVAPVDSIAAVPNNVAITSDGVTPSTPPLEDSGTLSQQDLSTSLGYTPGQPVTLDGVNFMPFARAAGTNYDNIGTLGNGSTYDLPIQPQGAAAISEVDLLVLSAGGSTPGRTATDYQMEFNYGDPTNQFCPFVTSSLPSIPDWTSTSAPADVATSTDATTVRVTRDTALAMPHYDSNGTVKPGPVYMYVLKIKIPTETDGDGNILDLRQIVLPPGATPAQPAELHVFAISVH